MPEQTEAQLRAIFADEAQNAPPSSAMEQETLDWANTQDKKKRASTRLVLVAAATAMAVAGISIGVARSGDQAVPAPVVAGQYDMQGPIGSSSATSCVEEYSSPTLKDRAFAFDGTAIAIGPSISDKPGARLTTSGVTFQVNEWFKGGSGDTVTVDMWGFGAASEEYGWPRKVPEGTRLLVSGEPRWGGSPLDQAIAWPCGFTRYYDPQTADQWRAAFSNKDGAAP